jgi:nucleotide-binding universal stress UspA family protein
VKILVPVDGSAASRRAVRHALELAGGRKGASIVLVNVQNVAALSLGEAATVLPPDWIDQAVKRASHSALNAAQAACRSAGVAFRTRTEIGPIAETVVRVARNERADQIVMGTRGLGRIRGLLLGSIATQVVHLAPMPVTLVK